VQVSKTSAAARGKLQWARGVKGDEGVGSPGIDVEDVRRVVRVPETGGVQVVRIVGGGLGRLGESLPGLVVRGRKSPGSRNAGMIENMSGRVRWFTTAGQPSVCEN
jgi:hypothetical protein